MTFQWIINALPFPRVAKHRGVAKPSFRLYWRNMSNSSQHNNKLWMLHTAYLLIDSENPVQKDHRGRLKVKIVIWIQWLRLLGQYMRYSFDFQMMCLINLLSLLFRVITAVFLSFLGFCLMTLTVLCVVLSSLFNPWNSMKSADDKIGALFWSLGHVTIVSVGWKLWWRHEWTSGGSCWCHNAVTALMNKQISRLSQHHDSQLHSMSTVCKVLWKFRTALTSMCVCRAVHIVRIVSLMCVSLHNVGP